MANTFVVLAHTLVMTVFETLLLGLAVLTLISKRTEAMVELANTAIVAAITTGVSGG
jgi:hypothetical protein